MTAPVRTVEFQRFLDRVLADPVARAAFERAQKRPSPLRIDGTELPPTLEETSSE